MADRNVIICADIATLSEKAAELCMQITGDAAARSGRCAIALSGGSTPRSLYALLASSGYTERMAWPKIHLFWGDERCVPPDHADSNYRMAREAMLSRIPIPNGNIHRMKGEIEPQVAAQEYAGEIRRVFELAPSGLPSFDLILLGLGNDGHTASLFPDTSALDDVSHLVAANYVEKLKAHRLTLTLPVINNAANILFLVSGSDKAEVVKQILENRSSEFPAAKLQPRNGRLIWLISVDAGGGLRR